MTLHSSSFPFGGIRHAAAKWLAWLLAIMLVSMILGAARFVTIDPLDRAFSIPAHATSGLITLALALGLWIVRIRIPSLVPASGMQDELWNARQHTAANLVLALTISQCTFGVFTAAVSPVAIRILYSGFNLSSLAEASVGTMALLRSLHFVNALALTIAIIAFLGITFWRQFVIRDGALVRLLPLSGLWFRLRGEDQAERHRFPSTRPNGWAKGRLS